MDKLLDQYDPIKIATFQKYINQLKTDKKKDGTLKNKWATYVQDKEFEYFFRILADEGLYIDGDLVTFQFKGKLMVSLSYQAYKNKVLNIYPETIFDMQLVRKADTFAFRKVNGQVLYSHEINDPFDKNEIVGTYCIIKNKCGEFIELMDMEEINKCRKVAKTDFIWANWTGEMILKTIIKRACKRHFKDIITVVDKLDNENYDLSKLNQSKIKKVDKPFVMFKELITGRKDFNELVVQFKALETIEEKREFYSVLKMEMIKK